MPSLSATITQGLFRLLGARKALADGEALRRRIETVRRPPGDPPASMAKTFDVTCRTVQGSKVYTLGPKAKKSPRHIIYLHGGGFIADMSGIQWSFVRKLVAMLDATVTVPLYPLLPDYSCTDVFDFLLPVYREVLEEAGPDRVTVMGDSAGATLSIALAQQARDGGLPQPAALVLICPCLDFTFSDPGQLAILPKDPMLDIPGLKAAGQWYANGLPVTDPRVSPLFGSMEGLAPIQLFAGTYDILLTDAHRLKAKAETQGIPVEYHQGEGLMHVWPLFFFPESREARERMRDFILLRTPNV